MERKLSVRRVAALQAGPLARYLAPLLTRSAASIAQDSYLNVVLSMLIENPDRSPAVRLAAADLVAVRAMEVAPQDPHHPTESSEVRLTIAGLNDQVRRRAAVLKEALYRQAGIDDPISAPAPAPHAQEPSSLPVGGWGSPERSIMPVVVWIPHLRSPFNVGNIIRTAAAFGVAGVIIGEAGPDLSHPRVQRAAMGAAEMIPVVRGDVSDAAHLLPGLPAPVVALETGGTPISRFNFPTSGVVVVGHEELGVSSDIVDQCRQAGMIVTIPHDGPKSSLNVGVAAGICLSWWQAQRSTG